MLTSDFDSKLDAVVIESILVVDNPVLDVVTVLCVVACVVDPAAVVTNELSAVVTVDIGSVTDTDPVVVPNVSDCVVLLVPICVVCVPDDALVPETTVFRLETDVTVVCNDKSAVPVVAVSVFVLESTNALPTVPSDTVTTVAESVCMDVVVDSDPILGSVVFDAISVLELTTTVYAVPPIADVDSVADVTEFDPI